jgi:hypothetical protein
MVSLNQLLKHSIFVASSLVLKMSFHYPQINHTYNELHKLTERVTPNMYCDYKNSILLYKTFNDRVPFEEFKPCANQYIKTKIIHYHTTKN